MISIYKKLEQRGVLNLIHLDFEFVSTVRCPVEDFRTCPERSRWIRISDLQKIQSTKDYVRIYQHFMQNKPNLKNAQMNLSTYLKMAYENKSNWTISENKPNQTQFKPNTNPISKIPEMNVNSYITKDYIKKDDFASQQNKPKQTQPVVSLSNLFQTQFLQRPKMNLKSLAGKSGHPFQQTKKNIFWTVSKRTVRIHVLDNLLIYGYSK